MAATVSQSVLEMVAAEQAAFAALVSTLDTEQFSVPSVCYGWDVRDVVVHAAAHIHGQQRNAGLLAEYRKRSDDDLVAWLASPVKVSRSPFKWFRDVDAHVQLGELVIHHQDVLRSLGRSRTIPAEHLRAVLDFGFRPLGSVALAGARRRSKGLQRRGNPTRLDVWPRSRGQRPRRSHSHGDRRSRRSHRRGDRRRRCIAALAHPGLTERGRDDRKSHRRRCRR